ncbi:MAG: beta strand repeat-containing protein, partial [Bacillota bacterium]
TNTWSITGNNSGTLNDGTATLTWSGFGSLTGGTGNDDFVFSSGVALTGSVSGGTGSDTLDFSAKTSTLVVNLTGSAANGYSGTTTGSATNPIAGGFTGIETVDGGTGSNTLNGENTANIWNVTGGDSGTYNDGAGNGSLTWNSFGNLGGGSSTDDFVFANGATLSGTVSGGAGADTLDYSAYVTATNVTLTGTGSNGVSGTDGGITGGFSGIDTITGSATAANTLTGENTANTWAINAADAGTLNDGTVTINWSNFGSLTGGSSTDSFTLSGTGNVTGTLSGGAGVNTLIGNNLVNAWALTGTGAGTLTDSNGSNAFTGIQKLVGGTTTDTLDYSGFGSAATVTISGTGTNDGFKGSATGITSFDNMNGLTGSGLGDTLVKSSGVNAWNLSGADSGDVNGFAYTNVANLTGGSGTDTFTINGGTVSGTITGGSGTETLVGDNAGDYFDVTGTNSGSIGTGSGTPANLVNAFTNVANLTGGTGADTFAFSGGTEVNIDGGAGPGLNTLDYSNLAGVVTDTLTGPGTNTGYAGTGTGITGGGAFDDINALVGDGNTGSQLTGENSANTWTITGAGTGQFTDGSSGILNFSGYNKLVGGTLSDTFNITNNASLTSISGGTGSDSVTVAANVTLTDAGTGTLTINADNISTTGVNSFLDAANQLDLTGNAINIGMDGTPPNLSIVGVGTATATITSNANIDFTNATPTAGGSLSLNLTATGAIDMVGASPTFQVTSLVATAGTSIVLANTSTNLNLGAITANGGKIAISSTGGITANGVTLKATSGGVTLTAIGGNVSFLNAITIQGGGLLTVNNLAANNASIVSSGGVTVTGNTSGNSLSLNTTNGKINLDGVNLTGTLTLIDSTSSQVLLNGNVNVNALTATNLAGAVVIEGSAVTLTVTGAGGLDLSAAKGIDGKTAGGQSLTLAAGSGTVVLPKVGASKALKSLTVTGSTIDAVNVTTSAGQSYTGALNFSGTLLNTGNGNITVTGGVTLSGADSITDNGSGNISITGAVDGTQQLAITANGGNVTLGGAIGAGKALAGLTIDADAITLNSTVSTVNNQAYTGDVTLNGDLTSSAGSMSFGGGKVDVNKNLVLTSNAINFNGAKGSVTTSNQSTLAIIPSTAGTNITIGSASSAGTLGLNGDAFNGYTGSLFIGAVPADVTNPLAGVLNPPVTTGNVTINGDIILGGSNNTLVVVSAQTLAINGTLQASNMIVGATVAVTNPAGTGNLVTNKITVVGGSIGAEGKDITVNAIGGAGGTLVFGTHGTQALFDLTGITKEPADASVSTYALDLNVQINSNAVLQNSGQQAATNQQTGGLLGSGFIDVSVFQQISLYDVNGSGIQLPADQCEEQSATGTGCGQ